jgi:uncharacterized membrane protein YphA (DoxX/SURF4 family)
MDRILRLLTWPAALFVAGTLLWYEQYKLTGNEGSVYLFTILSDWLGIHGYEKPFRLFVAIMEIAASILVVIPLTRVFGAFFCMGVMSGAIFFHLVSPLGIDPYHDGGALFKEALEVWASAAFILIAMRTEAIALVRRVVG